MKTRSKTKLGSVAALCAVVVACGGGGDSQDPMDTETLPPSTVRIDESLQPLSPPVVGATVSTVSTGDNETADFIDDEYVVFAETRSAVDAFVTRNGLSVATRMGGDNDATPGIYRVMGRSGRAYDDLPDLLQRQDSKSRGDLVFSSENAARTLALAAAESGANGLIVSPNWVFQSHEESRNVDNTTDVRYEPFARAWPYMSKYGPLAIGVDAAWNRLQSSSQRHVRTKVIMFDGGFRRSPDLPSDTRITPADAWNQPNPAKCGSGDCPWHGLATSVTLAGIENNRYGVAGSGGRHVDLELVSSPRFDLVELAEFAAAAVSAATSGARVMNVSSSAPIPAIVAWTADGLWSAVRIAAGPSMPLIVASAGNNGLDVDREDSFLGITWEKVLVAPCELEGVLCVGGTVSNWRSRDQRDQSSAWGSKGGNASVAIFAPYSYWGLSTKQASPDDGEVKRVAGTSHSSPFVAGIAALVSAANPSLSGSQVKDVLMGTARVAPDPVRRFVDADEAVRTTLGPRPPIIEGHNAGMAYLDRPYRIHVVNGGLGGFGDANSFAGATISARDPHSETGGAESLTLDLTASSSVEVTRTGARTFTLTPRQLGLVTVNFVLRNSQEARGQLSFMVGLPNVEFVIHGGSGQGWLGLPYYAAVIPYEEGVGGRRLRLPCSDVLWDITDADGVVQEQRSGTDEAGNCTLVHIPTKTGRLTLGARVVDSSSVIRRWHAAAITVDSPRGAIPSIAVVSPTGFIKDIAQPDLSWTLPYKCGTYRDLIAQSFYSDSGGTVDNVAIGLQRWRRSEGPFAPQAALSRIPGVGSNYLALVDLPAGEQRTRLPVTEQAKRDWIGDHAFVTTTVSYHGMEVTRPTIIPFDISCEPK